MSFSILACLIIRMFFFKPFILKKKSPNIYSVHTRDPNWEMDSFLKLTFQIFKVVIDFNSEISISQLLFKTNITAFKLWLLRRKILFLIAVC
jgi:hypothetical protein